MLSVVIITKNEEKMLPVCLESIKWADEIIVIDNNSTDNTVEVAQKYTKNIFSVDTQDFAELRNKAIQRATGDWILYIDADERVLAPLKEEILQLTASPTFSAFAISRRNIIFGSEERYGSFWPDWVIRLLRRRDFEKWIGRVHEYPKFKGELGYTNNSLLHLTHRDIDQVILKSLAWSKIDAELRLQANHPKMSGWRFLRILLSEFFNQGVKRRGFLSGTIGVIDSTLQVFSMFITYIRLWQLQQQKPLSKQYEEIDKKLIENEFRYL